MPRTIRILPAILRKLLCRVIARPFGVGTVCSGSDYSTRVAGKQRGFLSFSFLFAIMVLRCL